MSLFISREGLVVKGERSASCLILSQTVVTTWGSQKISEGPQDDQEDKKVKDFKSAELSFFLLSLHFFEHH